MSKTTFSTGTVVTSQFLNSIQNLQFNKNSGQPLNDGEYYKLTNDNLENTAGNVRFDYYNFVNQLQVTEGTGLVVNISGGRFVTKTGQPTGVPNTTISVPNNAISFVYIDEDNIVRVATNTPAIGLTLARVTASAGSITNIYDARVLNKVAPRPDVTKVLGGTGDEGSFTSTGNSTLTKGVYYFNNFTLNSSHTITIRDLTKIYCSGNFTINGTINIIPSVGGGGGLTTGTTQGINTGKISGNGFGGGGAVASATSYSWLASSLGSGGSSGIITADGASIGGPVAIAVGGTGGGGFIVECAGDIIINGSIIANGANAVQSPTVGPNSLASGGGGGSGGTIVLLAGSDININSSAVLEAKGGAGGQGRIGSGALSQANGGGGGGGGQVILNAPNVNVNVSATIDVSGGTQGTNNLGTFDRTATVGGSLGGGNGGGNGGDGGNGEGNQAVSIHNGMNGIVSVRLFRPVA